MDDKISVIVPVYNAKHSLYKCIESLLRQSYPNIEIVLVDNNSTDGSELVCEKYESVSENIIFTRCKIRGAAAARNIGIEISSGQYIMFVDSDDYVEPDYCKNMINAIKKNNADLCISGMRRVTTEGKLLESCEGIEFFCRSILEFQNELLELDHRLLLNAPVNKIYKRSLIKVKFNNDFQIGEDLLFNLEYIKQDQIKICGIKDILYNYIIFSDLTQEKLLYYSKNRLESNILLYKKLEEIGELGNFSNKFFQEIKTKYLNNILFCYKEWISLGMNYTFNKALVKKMISNSTVQQLATEKLESCIKRILVLLIKRKSIRVLSILLTVAGRLYKMRKANVSN